MSTQPALGATPIKKRRRPAVSCERCRQRKVKCDKQSPCNNCTKTNYHPCTYVETHIPKAKARKTSPHPQRSPANIVSVATTTANSGPFSSPSAHHTPGTTLSIAPGSSVSQVEHLQARVQELEARLNGDDKTGRLVVDHENHSEDNAYISCQSNFPSRGTVSKTRYFGQSHWMNGASMFSFEMRSFGNAEFDKGALYETINKCKMLARKIKRARVKPVVSTDLRSNIPHKQLADTLVESYLNTFEGVLRILHVPTFRADYEKYWQNTEAASEGMVMMLKLVMALGGSVRDDSLSLRASAMQWVHEAQLWVTMPPEKSRMTIQGIQIMCLITLAKSVLGVGQDLTWVFAGSLLRTAMYMGLHRDPKRLVEMKMHGAEMRRRLWATILELNLQFATDAGGSALISEADYDALPPADLDDDELTDEPDLGADNASSSRIPTQTTLANALSASFPLRLRLVKHINDFRASESYDDTLKLNAELTDACRKFSTTMTALKGKTSASGSVPISSFHVMLGEMLLYRFFQTLHIPILSRAFDNPKYHYSRQIGLDSALKISDLWGFTDSRNHREGPDAGFADFRRLSVAGTGMFRNIAVQAHFIICREFVQNSLNASSGLGFLPPGIRSHEIREHLEGGRDWTLERIRAGETSVKGHCFVTVCLARADALSRGLDQAQTTQLMLERATESVLLCYSVLQELAAIEGVSVNDDEQSGGGLEDVDGIMGAVDLDWQMGLDWDNSAMWRTPWWQMSMGPLDDVGGGASFFTVPS